MRWRLKRNPPKQMRSDAKTYVYLITDGFDADGIDEIRAVVQDIQNISNNIKTVAIGVSVKVSCYRK